MRQTGAAALIIVLELMASAPVARAQGWVLDARRIGMGGAGTHQDDSVRMTCEYRSYRYIGLPFGLIQVAENTDVFDPNDPEFNPILALEYVANPMQIIFHREGSAPAMQLVSDLVNSELNPNLNAYRGFTPAQNFKAQGLFSPHWGNTFKFPQPHDPEHPRNPKNFQGIYLGAGPYFSLGTDVVIDPLLIDIFSSPTPVFFPNTTLTTHSTTELQTAAALTGGYRARFSAPEFLRNSFMKDKQPCDGNGVYITANLNYLQGLHYENIDSNVDLNTNALGLVELIPSTTPVVVNRLFGNGGHGFSVDFAGAVVVDRFSVSVAIRGIGNYIDWRDLEVEKWELNSVFTGASFVHSEPVHVGGKTRVKLPTRYSVLAGYHAPRWSTDVDVFYGLNKFEFYGGAEYRWHMLDFRAGARRSLGLWNPAAGVGINFTRKVGLDIAGFGTTTDLELQRKAGIAASLRIERKK